MLTTIKEQIRKARIKAVRLRACIQAGKLPISSKTVIIAPHPDDEIIGCAGLIQHLLLERKEVHIIFLTGGEASHSGCCQINLQKLTEARRELAMNINKELGILVENLHFLDYPDGGINYEHQETDRLNALLERIRPHTIFIPHKGEGWSDHLQAANIIKRLTESKTGVRLYEFCVWFWYYNTWKIDWKNARLLRMTQEECLKKNKAIDAYIHPQAPCGRPWSGVLPKVFIEANRWNKELYFKIR